MVNFCLCLEEPLFLIISEDEISTYSCQEMEPLHSMLVSVLRIELNWRIFASKQCSCMEGVLCSTRTAKQILPLHHAHQDLKLKKIIILLNIICNNITILSVIICGKTQFYSWYLLKYHCQMHRRVCPVFNGKKCISDQYDL